MVIDGKLLEECRRNASQLVGFGMIVKNRFISDEELLSLYGVADLTSCVSPSNCYQASGVFGRSIQLGLAPLIREE